MQPDDPSDALTELAYRFLTPGCVPAKPVDAEGLSHRLPLATPPGWRDGPVVDVHVRQRGRGPAALLVHGWRGQAADLSALAERLIGDGFTVWQPDLPAHGLSGGRFLSLPLAAAALTRVQHLAGPFAFAAGHSFGGAALVQALTVGLQSDRVALLASPTHYGTFARLAATQAGLAPDRAPEWLAVLGRIIGTDPDLLDMREQVRTLSQRALLVHSDDDPIAPFQAAQIVAGNWPGARWWPRQGLGHFKLLKDEETLAELRSFAAAAR